MEELSFVAADSDASSLVLRSTQSGTEFFLPVTDELKHFVAGATGAAGAAPARIRAASESDANLEEFGAEATSTARDAVAGGVGEEHGEGAPESAAPAEGTDAGAEIDPSDEAAADSGAAPEEPAASPVGTSTAAQTAMTPAAAAAGRRPHRTKISLSPRTIQDRIRYGATIAELAQEADTDESRIEPYAFPILQERARIADLARTALPVSAEGASKLTLWEVLATSLAARGENLADSSWDANQSVSRQWIVAVSWEKTAAGQTATHVAEFVLSMETGKATLAHPHNSIAGDLVDPRYGQPVRSIAPVSPLIPTAEDDYPAGDAHSHPDSDHGHPSARGHAHGGGAQPGQAGEAGEGYANNTYRADFGGRDREFVDDRDHWEISADSDHATPYPGEDPADGESHPGDGEQPDPQHPGTDFLINPGPQSGKPRRKRKAVTPHWEDVLLGVRTNPKKKK